MTTPNKRDVDDFRVFVEEKFPTTWPGLVAEFMRRFGFAACVIVILLGMLGVVFYYLQKANERSQVANERLINCISEATATMRSSSLITTGQNAELQRHQKWEEDTLKENLPRITRIEDDIHRLTQKPSNN